MGIAEVHALAAETTPLRFLEGNLGEHVSGTCELVPRLEVSCVMNVQDRLRRRVLHD